MAKYVKISPLTRLEGHLGITARINNDAVSAAYSHGEMFRGLEKILIGRDPRDAPVITSRTCGVCHFIHRHCSLRAIENAAGWSFPAPQAYDAIGGKSLPPNTQTAPGSLERWLDPNRDMQAPGSGGTNRLPGGAQLARNIVHGLTLVYSHAAHTIALAAPDYKHLINDYIINYGDQLPGYTDDGASFFDNFYNEAIVAQRILHEMLGFLGGKAPHQQSAIPGGFSRSFKGQLETAGSDMDAISTLATKTIGLGGSDPSNPTDGESWSFIDLSGGLDARKYFNNADDWISSRLAPFTIALAVAGVQAGAHTWGEGSNNFVCAPTFDIVDVDKDVGEMITGDAYFRGGVVINDASAANGAGTYRLNNCAADSGSSNWVTIYEDITSGKYPVPDDITEKPVCGGYPGDSETHPLVGEAADRYVYTWYKATRVKDSNDKLFAVESGPFARLVVNSLDPHLNLHFLGSGSPPTLTLPLPGGSSVTFDGSGLRTNVYGGSGGEWKSSTWNRLIGRLQDTLLLIDLMVGSNYTGENPKSMDGWLSEAGPKTLGGKGCWLTRLNDAIGTDGGPIAAAAMVQDTPPNGVWENLKGVAGAGYWDAPRGITCHFCKIDDGLLTQYQHIAGTTWNGSGRDAEGNPGPFEWSLMGMAKVETEVPLTEGSGGRWTGTLTGPVCERTVFIEYDLQYSASSGTETCIATDRPRHDGTEMGQIVGQGLKATSVINYKDGDVTLEFKYNYDQEYNYVSNVKVVQYGYANNPVPTPAAWVETGEPGYGYSGSEDETKPNPINILRTIRSYDPCLACSIHVVDKKGKVGKYEAVPVAGWEVK